MQIGTPGSAYGRSRVMSRPTVGRAINAVPAYQLIGANRPGEVQPGGGRMLPVRYNPQVNLAELANRLAAARQAAAALNGPFQGAPGQTDTQPQWNPAALPHEANLPDEVNPHATMLPLPSIAQAIASFPHPAQPPMVFHAPPAPTAPPPVFHAPPAAHQMPFVFHSGPAWGGQHPTSVDPAQLLARARLAAMFRTR